MVDFHTYVSKYDYFLPFIQWQLNRDSSVCGRYGYPKLLPTQLNLRHNIYLGRQTTETMGDSACYRDYCPDCDLEVTITAEQCPECGTDLSQDSV